MGYDGHGLGKNGQGILMQLLFNIGTNMKAWGLVGKNSAQVQLKPLSSRKEELEKRPFPLRKRQLEKECACNIPLWRTEKTYSLRTLARK
jgi:hypothetical protein